MFVVSFLVYTIYDYGGWNYYVWISRHFSVTTYFPATCLRYRDAIEMRLDYLNPNCTFPSHSRQSFRHSTTQPLDVNNRLGTSPPGLSGVFLLSPAGLCSFLL